MKPLILITAAAALLFVSLAWSAPAAAHSWYSQTTDPKWGGVLLWRQRLQGSAARVVDQRLHRHER